MKNEKDQKDTHSPTKKNQPENKQWNNQSDLEGGRGANQNDDRSEDSKGGGSRGLGNQEGANQGYYEGGAGKR